MSSAQCPSIMLSRSAGAAKFAVKVPCFSLPHTQPCQYEAILLVVLIRCLTGSGVKICFKAKCVYVF